MTIKFDDESQKQQIKDLRDAEAESLAQALSSKYNVPYINLSSVIITPDSLRIIDEIKARALNVAPFSVIGKKVSVGTTSPAKEDVQAYLADLSKEGYTPTLFIVSQSSLEKAWGQYKQLSLARETSAGSLDISNDEIIKLIGQIHTIKDTSTIITATVTDKKKMRTSRITEIIVAGAMAAEASDIHIEPEESYVRLRYRLDGVLNDVTTFDHNTYTLLLSRVKLLSGLKLNVKDNAQDGRFSVSLNNTDIEIRTSILPGSYGEAIVLRLLNPKTISVPLEELGIDGKLLGLIKTEIDKPNGMLLTTGPTGSGKTTTLYAFLKKIYSTAIKVITIEDPVEYHLPGIVQTQTDDKTYTFSSGLRSALRQDPDVIMVGEIRDGETAEIAINASLTGHLVFSTLHTNNAAGAFPRLIELGVNSKIIASAVTLTMAQRLIRRLCPVCKKKIPLQDKNKTLVEQIVRDMPQSQKIAVPSHIFESVGCPACNNTGYKGRTGIYEGIHMNKKIEELVNSNPSEREIALAARNQGLTTMAEDGILKVLQGITSIDELRRVIDIDEAGILSKNAEHEIEINSDSL